MLSTMGFDEERQQQTIAALSGGWKMKLSLGRAMLMKADILVRHAATSPCVCACWFWSAKSRSDLPSELSSVPCLHSGIGHAFLH